MSYGPQLIWATTIVHLLKDDVSNMQLRSAHLWEPICYEAAERPCRWCTYPPREGSEGCFTYAHAFIQSHCRDCAAYSQCRELQHVDDQIRLDREIRDSSHQVRSSACGKDRVGEVRVLRVLDFTQTVDRMLPNKKSGPLGLLTWEFLVYTQSLQLCCCVLTYVLRLFCFQQLLLPYLLDTARDCQ